MYCYGNLFEGVDLVVRSVFECVGENDAVVLHAYNDSGCGLVYVTYEVGNGSPTVGINLGHVISYH